MTKISYIFIVFFFVGSITNAQDKKKERPFWLEVSGGGSPEYINFSSAYNKSLANLSYQIALNISGKDIFSRYEMTTGNVGVGFANTKNWLISSIFLGPSLSYGEGKMKSGSATNFWGIGISFNAQAYFMPLYKLFPGLGLGLEFFYNFNVSQTKDVSFRHVYVFRIGFCITNLHDK